MTKCDINLLYADLNKLLDEICEFLSEEVQNEKLSVKAKHEASQLIERSKKQLVAISKVSSVIPDNDSGRYVDMHGNKGEQLRNTLKIPEEVYSSVDESAVEIPRVSLQLEALCPYENTSAQDIPRGAKYGYLDRKGKFLFIEHQKKIYACVHENWMLIYSSEKDQKPTETINLKQFEAKESESSKDKKHVFDLTCTAEPTKIYIFTASTKKDVLQWVEAINGRSGKTLDQRDSLSIMDVIHSKQRQTLNILPTSEVEEQDELYAKLMDDDVQPESPKKPALIPVLPPRTPQKTDLFAKGWDPKLRPVPSIPIDEPLEADYDPVNSGSLDTNSFSEVDSNVSYDELINSKAPKEDDFEDDAEYDEVLNLPLPEQKNDLNSTPTKDMMFPKKPNEIKNKKKDEEELSPRNIEFANDKNQLIYSNESPESKPKPKPKPKLKPKLFRMESTKQSSNKVNSIVSQLTRKHLN